MSFLKKDRMGDQLENARSWNDLADLNLGVLGKMETHIDQLDTNIRNSVTYAEQGNLSFSEPDVNKENVKIIEKLKQNAKLGENIFEQMRSTARSVGKLREINFDIQAEQAKLDAILNDPDTATLKQIEKMKHLHKLGLNVGIHLKQIAGKQVDTMMAYAEVPGEDSPVTTPEQEQFEFFAFVQMAIQVVQVGMKIFQAIMPILQVLGELSGGKDGKGGGGK